MLGSELTCIRCGYELRGSDPGGACPECAMPVADSIRAGSTLNASARRFLRAASIMSAIAALGWIPLAIFAFERRLPQLLADVVEWVFRSLDIVQTGAAGFAVSGTMLATQVVLLVRVLGWRGRAVWTGTIVIALVTIACGIMLSLATIRLRVDRMEMLLLVQSIAGLVVTGLWFLLYRRVTQGRWRWPAVTIVIAAGGTAAWTYVVLSAFRDDPWLWAFVIGTVFNFGSCAAIGRSCLRPTSRALKHRRQPLADADAQ